MLDDQVLLVTLTPSQIRLQRAQQCDDGVYWSAHLVRDRGRKQLSEFALGLDSLDLQQLRQILKKDKPRIFVLEKNVDRGEAHD